MGNGDYDEREGREVSFRVEHLYGKSNNWTSTGSYSSEQTAIFNAKSVAK